MRLESITYEVMLEELLVEARDLILEMGESIDVPLQFRQHGWLNTVNDLIPPKQ